MPPFLVAGLFQRFHQDLALQEMIEFGTSGWRAIIADEFSFEAVRHVTQAIADLIPNRSPGSQVIVGNDTRFMAEVFAPAGAAILAASGLHPLLRNRATPTTAIAFAVRFGGRAEQSTLPSSTFGH